MNTNAVKIDPVWEEKYSAGQEVRYPVDGIANFVYHNAPKDRPRHEVKVLEVGCGTGHNLWFAAREGFSTTGFDGSESAIVKARQRFEDEGLVGDFRVGDFRDLPYENDMFDLVIDRVSLVCVGFEAAKTAIREIHRVTSGGGDSTSILIRTGIAAASPAKPRRTACGAV